MQDRIFYAICFGFIFGVLWRSFFFVNLYLMILFGVISVALFLFFTLVSKNNWGIVISIFILIFCFGVFRFQMVDVSASSVFELQVGQKVSFSGIIVDEPDLRENNQKLTLQVLAPQGLALDSLKARSSTAKTKILATVNFNEDFKYGDKVKFFGKLEKPENFITDQGKNFDYLNFLRKD